MSKELSITGLRDKYESIESPLSDQTLLQTPHKGDVEEDLPVRLGGAVFTVSGEAEVQLFNAASDTDADGVIGERTEGPTADFDLEPVFVHDRNAARLKYTVRSTMKGKFDSVLDLNGETALSLLSYRSHDPDSPLWKALSRDLAEPRLILDRKSVTELEPGEAVALKARGKLKASLDVKWADILTNNMSALSEQLGLGEAFTVEVGASAFARCNVTIEDDYVLVMACKDIDTIEVFLRKADKRQVSNAIGASISAKLADPDAAKAVIDKTLEGLFDETIRKVDNLARKASFEELKPAERKLAEKLIERLGLDDDVKTLAELSQKITGIREKIRETLEQAAEKTVELNFTYEYSRLETEAAVLQGSLSTSQLGQYHLPLLRGDFSGFVTAAAAGGRNAPTIERFMREKTIVVDETIGFGLGFGRWKAFGRAVRRSTFVERQNRHNKIQASLVGVRGYESDWFGERWDHHLEFDASMKNYSNGSIPQANEFQLSLGLVSTTVRPKVSEDDLHRAIDMATLTGATTESDEEEPLDSLRKALKDKEDVTFIQLVTIKPEAFEEMLPVLALRDNQRVAESLAAALSWRDGYRGLRASPRNRIHLYQNAWRRFLDDPAMTSSNLAGIAHAELRGRRFPRLAKWERDAGQQTIADHARLHGDLREDWQRFFRGMSRLHRAWSGQKPYGEIRDAWDDFRHLGEHTSYARSLAWYLLSVARELPLPPRSVERSLTVRYEKSGKPTTMVISVSS